MKKILFVLCWLCILPVFASETAITSIAVTGNAPEGQVTIRLDGNASYSYFTLHNPERLVIDFTDATISTNVLQQAHYQALISQVRTGKPKPGVLRIVFDTTAPVQATSASVKQLGLGGQELLLQLQADRTPAPATIKKATTELRPVTTSAHLFDQAGQRDVIVVIDPGHGGKDPGAIGPKGTKERDVVLAIAKKLADLINKEPGMKAVMTRDKDYYVTLRERLDKARENKGDIFVAIHADAFKNERSRGASVFALSLKGASSEAARWLAAKENYSELGGIDLDDKDDLLRSVLIDLSQTATIGSSLQLGGAVLQEMGGVAKLHHRKVEQAPFVVLKSPDIPSILVETGFLSNPSEEKQLLDNAYQYQVANAVMRGIRSYFYQSPPPATWIAAHPQKNHTYVVAAGDSLSSIAQQFNVNIHKLRKENQLSGSRINVGQTLRIPQAQA